MDILDEDPNDLNDPNALPALPDETRDETPDEKDRLPTDNTSEE